MSNENEKPMRKKDIIQEISEVTNLKRDIVRSVLDAFIDIFIRETVMKGRFILSNCFSVSKHKRKARKQYNVESGEMFEYPETEVLSIKLSRKINGYFRWKKRHEFNEKNNLTVEDWQNRDNPKLPTGE